MRGQWWAKLRSWSRRRQALADLDEELDAQLELAIEDYLERGLSPAAARTAAYRRLGNRELTRERTRDAWRFLPLDTFVQDVRHGVRGWRRAPGFALLVILTLALGIGATTAVFSVVYAVLLRPLPYPDGDRLAWIGESTGNARGISVTWMNFRHWRHRNRSFEALAGFEMEHMTWSGHGEEARLLRLGAVTSDFFDLLGAVPFRGRLLTAEDDRPGAAPVIVVSHEFWQARLGGDPGALETALTLDGRAYDVVGVTAPGWRYFNRPIDGYTALGTGQGSVVRRDEHGSMRVLGRLAAGVGFEDARDDLDGIMRMLAVEDPGSESEHRSEVRALSGLDARASRPLLLTLFAAVVGMLLIACVNVANLTLARSAMRSRELAIRAALGSGRFRLGRQLLVEHLLVAAVGGLAGLALAAWGMDVLAAAGPPGIPRLAEVELDRHVLLFAAGLTLGTALVAGLAPLSAAGRLALVPALHEGVRAAGRSPRRHAVERLLVVGEIAMTLVLAFACSLFVRSLVAAENRDPGLAPDRLLALDLVLPRARDGSADEARRYFDRLQTELAALPGVTAVGAANCPPAVGGCGDWFYSVLDRPAPAPGDVPVAFVNTATPAYFGTMGIPIRQGRAFAGRDREGAPPVAIVNEAFARRWWPSGSAIGRRIKMGGPYREGTTHEIVGVAGDVSQFGLDGETGSEIYLSFAQSPQPAMAVMLRTAQDPEGLTGAVRRAVADLDPEVAVQGLRPFRQTLEASLDRRRFGTALLTLFAGLALLLAFVGIYGLLGGWVAARRSDIAVRMALGADRGAIARWAGAHALRLCTAGVVLGGVVGWAVARSLEGLLFAVSARSPGAFLLATAAVVGSAAAAAAWPLWRATRVEVTRTLSQG